MARTYKNPPVDLEYLLEIESANHFEWRLIAIKNLVVLVSSHDFGAFSNSKFIIQGDVGHSEQGFYVSNFVYLNKGLHEWFDARSVCENVAMANHLRQILIKGGCELRVKA
jgi:hypothetical protein